MAELSDEQQQVEAVENLKGEGNEAHLKIEEDESSKEETSSLKEKSIGIKKSNRFHPYSKEKTANGDKKGYNRNRVFISNIPYDMKWQAIKDLMREKVGEVTYVELFKDAEGKSRVSGTILVVEFKTEDFVNKAMDIMNKFDLSGRPLTIKEDPDGEHARRAMQRGSYPGVLGLDMGSPIVNLPPNIVNNPNIPSEVITALQGGRLGTTVFVANLDFKVGWKKLKEVFCMAGVVKRADIKEDKDGKSRGIGTVTFDQSIEAVQAISMFNGQLLFDRPMHVKMDDKSVPHDDYRVLESKSQQLPRKYARHDLYQIVNFISNVGFLLLSGMSGPSGFGSGMDAMNNMGGYGGGSMSGIGNMGRMGGMGPIDDFRGNLAGGMGNMGGNMGGMGSNMSGFGATGSSVGGMGSNMGDMYRPGMGSGAMGGSFDRDFGRNDMGMNRGFGESFGGMGGGMGGGLGGNLGGGMATTSMGPIGSGMGGGMAGMNSMGGVMGMGMDRMGSNLDRMGSGMGVGLDRNMDMDRGFGNLNTGSMGSGLRERGSGFRGCQIFARNVSHVMFAEIKMENGMSKGCGTVLFDTPEAAEKACRLMNGTKITGREIDVRLDRNA
uniref:Myelin expression factor 2 n=1 Tax=Callorhinchus milii TaxID=7868 RepID=A0A4W3K4S6_CALMI